MRMPSPLAGQPVPESLVIDVGRLIAAYHADVPDARVAEQRVIFGTSGHRGSAFERTFNEGHVLAITQAICHSRVRNGIDGPLFLGMDTHALSAPACASALEVCAANGVVVMLAANDEYTPTPAVSHAILGYNRGRAQGFADGIVVTPSHNPPRDGGIKYNPPHGGPAGKEVTQWIEDEANRLLASGLEGVRRTPHAEALRASTTRRHDFLDAYVADLSNVIDMEAIAGAKVRIGVDPLGGAGVRYWPAIADRYALDLTVTNEVVDPTFRFMTVDGDGQIRMDPSSSFAMQRLIDLKDRFDVAFACDPDHDRHGIVVPNAGLLLPNHYLSVAVDYLFRHRPRWNEGLGVGKSVVTTRMIDLVARGLRRRVHEMPVGFKWFVQGLQSGTLACAMEESAGAAFVRHDGSVWTTDKDGITAALLSAEITARTGRNPALHYAEMTERLGNPAAARVEAPATRDQAARLAALLPADVGAATLGGEAVDEITNTAPSNHEPIGGIRISTRNAWIAARPSGTEPLYKIYGESFVGPDHLRTILAEAQAIVDGALAPQSDAATAASLAQP